MRKQWMMAVLVFCMLSMTACIRGKGDVGETVSGQEEGDMESIEETIKVEFVMRDMGEELEEYQKIVYGEEENETETESVNPFDLESKVQDFAVVTLADTYDKESMTVECSISAPDIYNYLISNEEELMRLDTEELYQRLLEECQKDDFPKREVTISLPVVESDGELLVDISGDEYKDATSGGMYSAINYVYVQMIQEMISEEADSSEETISEEMSLEETISMEGAE